MTRHFEVRYQDSLGALLGTVEADNCFRAAELACVKFFGGVAALRETGWGGGSGTWKTITTKKKQIIFWLGEPPPEPKPQAPTTLKPKKKR
jgi:hypothetical protein